MRRFFTEPENINKDYAVITEDAPHITRVLRMSVGDEVCVFDGKGREYTCVLEEVDQKCCKARITDVSYSLYEPNVQVTVYQGVPKSGKMEQIIQKAVELGVYAIVPVQMDRCVAKIPSDRKGKEKIDRYQKVSVSAAKQCGRGIIPQIKMPHSFSEVICEMKNFDLALMPYEVLGHEGRCDLKSVLKENKGIKSIGILIGPEGGFSDGEASFAMSEGIKAVGLGRRILRTETVASTLLSAIMYENDEF